MLYLGAFGGGTTAVKSLQCQVVGLFGDWPNRNGRLSVGSVCSNFRYHIGDLQTPRGLLPNSARVSAVHMGYRLCQVTLNASVLLALALSPF